MPKICPHCGYQNADDNDYCASCGTQFKPGPQTQDQSVVDAVPVSQVPPHDTSSAPKEDDDVIRCPNCGSKNINFVTSETGTGFDKSNACCGYILLGPLGLLCGINEKKTTKTVRKCMKCGHEF